MPKRLFRLLAFALLALAIPVQGMAAIMAGQCMALGHHQHAAGHGDNGHQHVHPDEGMSHSADGGGEADGGHCGPCVACCASASIASSFATVSASAAHTAVEQVPYVFLAGVQPEDLDRPPLAL